MKKIKSKIHRNQSGSIKPRNFIYLTLPLVLSACSMLSSPPSTTTHAPSKWWFFNSSSSIKNTNTNTNTNDASGSSGQMSASLIPHQGSLTDLKQWWSSLEDPILLELIAQGQQLSPTVALAQTRIEQARAQQTISQANGSTNLAASLGLSRGRTDPTLPVANMFTGSMQASWEIDLWGTLALGKNAANRRLEGSQASWHEARVSVAAEVATVYYNLINCERQSEQSDAQMRSLKESQRLNALLVTNGFLSSSDYSYSVLALSQSENNLAQINAQCRSLKNALFALTGVDESRMLQWFAQGKKYQFPASVKMPVVPEVPAQLLVQRPDVWAAESEVAAARAEVAQSKRQNLPRLSLSGSITAIRANASDVTTILKTWSVGPLAFTLPILEGGKIQAQQQVANAQYDQAVVQYQAKVRQAVQETHDALSQLVTTDEQAQSALKSFYASEQIYLASELKFKQGLISALQLEESKRQMLSSKMAMQSAELQRMNAWIGLYRVLGGGWTQQQQSNESTSKVPS